MATTIRSFSKINLGLAIGPAREDGFHSLATVYQTLALYDRVTVEARPARTTSMILSSNNPRVPTDASNTAWRMAERVLAVAGRTAHILIHIEKRLPIEGGLGAGSANAAATLLALERELGITIPEAARMRMAAEVGSDVPLFLSGGMTYGCGRGEITRPLTDSPSLPCVVALPGVGVSTAQAFRDWDNSLTASAASSKMNRLSESVGKLFDRNPLSGVFHWKDLAESPLLALVRTGIDNDFEQVVFPKYPLLGKIKRVLSFGSGEEDRSGLNSDSAIYAALSGSGSAVFGLYRTPSAAEQVIRRLQVLGVAAVQTRTLPRSEYEEAMWASEPV